MPVWRLQCSIQADTPFPQDAIIITPHFNDAGATTDPDNLCEDMATALALYWGTTREIRVKAYDAQGTPPVYPQGEAVRNLGQYTALSAMREVAICLSYYSQQNRPRYRGRLYMPAGALAIDPSSARPTNANRQKVADFVPICTGLGGVDVDWCVYSRVDNVARPVSNWWVDDAWDVQRSRGLSPTTRLVGSVSE